MIPTLDWASNLPAVEGHSKEEDMISINNWRVNSLSVMILGTGLTCAGICLKSG